MMTLVAMLTAEIPTWAVALLIFLSTVSGTVVVGWFWHNADKRYVKQTEFDESEASFQKQLDHNEASFQKQLDTHEESQKLKLSELRTEMTRAHIELREQASRQFKETQQAFHDLRETINAGQLRLVEVVSEMRGELRGLIRDKDNHKEAGH